LASQYGTAVPKFFFLLHWIPRIKRIWKLKNFEIWTRFDIKIIQNTFYGFQLGFFKIRYLIIHLIFLKRKQQKNFSLNYSTGFSASREVGN
jgi:hypothetical protein